MLRDRQTLLEKLRGELAFIESGGYRNPAHAEWRPQFMFEDSPTCLNRDPTQSRKPCSGCALVAFVPEGFAKKPVPCRYIPLNERGETVDSFYRTGTHEELEAAVVRWLKTTIDRLEQENEEPPTTDETPKNPRKARLVSLD